MHSTSSLILRSLRSELGQQPANVLLINPPRDSLARELLPAGSGTATVFTQDFGSQHFFESSGIESTFGLLPTDQDLPGQVILFLPREKELLEFLLHFLSVHMPADGKLWLAGENKAGIKSAEARLEQRFAQVRKCDSARHCVLYRAEQPIAGKPFAIEDYRQQWTLQTQRGELQLHSLPGSFAHGRLDKGTALLLDFLQSPDGQKLKLKGKMLDFGCGVGVIGLVLKQQNPDIALDMLDSSASALESTRLSLQDNGYEARIIAADGLDTLKARYDWIISNPPFHLGISADLDVAHRMIARAPALLGNRGRMLVVCNRHLRYEPWMNESFGGCEKVLENREFKVLLASGPASASRRGTPKRVQAPKRR